MSNPEATNHAAVIRAAIDSCTFGSHVYDARAALDALLAERDAALEERNRYKGMLHASVGERRRKLLVRAQAAEASLTRYRNALEQIAAMKWTKASDIARAALDGPKEEQT